jgi:ring-1,2-phenylacetyl-CoA epoxidase subunit PaaC
LKPAWDQTVQAVLEEATFSLPEQAWQQKGGKQGVHSEHLGHMLAEMQFLQRAYPDASW